MNVFRITWQLTDFLGVKIFIVYNSDGHEAATEGS